jgi:hypothetical protein
MLTLSLRSWTFALAVLLVIGGTPASGQIYNLPRPDTADVSSFGVSVAIDGGYAVVGASAEDDCGMNSGAAYVYERNGHGGPWQRVARLTPSECRANAFFGESVDVSGERIIVSASSEFFASEKSNAAYVYERDTTGTWRETARLTGIVGEKEGLFASGVALDGDRAVVTTSGNMDGAYGGTVYVFEYDADADFWRRTARLRASRGTEKGVLGGTVSLDGNTIAVAASTYFQKGLGSVYVFGYDPATETWSERAILPGINDFFISLNLHGSRLIVGESRAGEDESGEATMFAEANGGSWKQVHRLQPSTPYESGAFGSTVSIRDEWALVTGYDEQLGQDFNIDRVVYVYKQSEDGSWAQRTIIDIGEVAFGASIDQDGSTAIISSVPEDEPGAVYVVQLQ